MKPIEWDNEAFDEGLVLDEEKKKMIKSLVYAYYANNTKVTKIEDTEDANNDSKLSKSNHTGSAFARFDESIEGKGKGKGQDLSLIINLFGNLGTWKTLTAEKIAECKSPPPGPSLILPIQIASYYESLTLTLTIHGYLQTSIVP